MVLPSIKILLYIGFAIVQLAENFNGQDVAAKFIQYFFILQNFQRTLILIWSF